MKKNVMTNAVEPAKPQSVWGKGCAGKGGKTNNSNIIANKVEKESK